MPALGIQTDIGYSIGYYSERAENKTEHDRKLYLFCHNTPIPQCETLESLGTLTQYVDGEPTSWYL